MALMPMPPMPRMCRGPISPGICIALSPSVVRARASGAAARRGKEQAPKPLRAFHRTAYQLLDEIGEARHRIGSALALGSAGGLLKHGRRLEEPAQHAGQAFGGQVLLLNAPGP